MQVGIGKNNIFSFSDLLIKSRGTIDVVCVRYLLTQTNDSMSDQHFRFIRVPFQAEDI